jgi:hypothetical protein
MFRLEKRLAGWIRRDSEMGSFAYYCANAICSVDLNARRTIPSDAEATDSVQICEQGDQRFLLKTHADGTEERVPPSRRRRSGCPVRLPGIGI